MTAHQVIQRAIPQMRTPSEPGPAPLTVDTSLDGRVAVLTMSGAALTDSLAPLLIALDAVVRSDARAVVLDCSSVTTWSRRGLEIAVVAATRDLGRRFTVAACGLRDGQREMLRREWPGVGPERFAFRDRPAALAAIVAHGD